MDQLIAKALEKDRSRRWQTAAEMRVTLADLRANLATFDVKGKGKGKLQAAVGRAGSRRSLLRGLALRMAIAVVLTGSS
jgi:hypothetical protein